MRLLSSKLAIVICGALFVGIMSGALAAFTAMHPQTTAAPLSSNGQASGSTATSSSSSGATATATTADTTTGEPTTSNPTAVPTSTPRILPTPTTPPIGAQLSLSGTVVSTGTNSFVLRYYHGTVTITCNVSSGTNWTNTGVTSFNALVQDIQAQNNVHATVTGTYQSDGSLNASSVNAYVVIDN